MTPAACRAYDDDMARFVRPLLALALLLGLVQAAPPSRTKRIDNPTELGKVRWHRDHDAAFAAARKLDRDVLILFQEVPG